MSTGINYSEKIPNNVNLSEDKTLQRALEQWQPNYISWWNDMGPDGSQNFDVYLRTAISVDPQGWAQFGHVKMPDYRWGIFLNPKDEGRKVNFGEHKGEAAWQEVPGEHRANLRRIIVTQGDTEPASVEQQRHLGRAQIARVELHELFPIQFQVFEDVIQKLAAGVGPARGDHIVVGLLLLEHQPHGFDVFLGIAPITLGIQIAQFQRFLLSKMDFGNSISDFTSDEFFATQRGFMVEQDATTRE